MRSVRRRGVGPLARQARCCGHPGAAGLIPAASQPRRRARRVGGGGRWPSGAPRVRSWRRLMPLATSGCAGGHMTRRHLRRPALGSRRDIAQRTGGAFAGNRGARVDGGKAAATGQIRSPPAGRRAATATTRPASRRQWSRSWSPPHAETPGSAPVTAARCRASDAARPRRPHDRRRTCAADRVDSLAWDIGIFRGGAALRPRDRGALGADVRVRLRPQLLPAVLASSEVVARMHPFQPRAA